MNLEDPLVTTHETFVKLPLTINRQGIRSGLPLNEPEAPLGRVYCSCPVCVHEECLRAGILQLSGEIRCPGGASCSEILCLFSHADSPARNQPHTIPVRKDIIPQFCANSLNYLGSGKSIQYAISPFTHVVFGPGASVDRVILRPGFASSIETSLLYRLPLRAPGLMTRVPGIEPNVIHISWSSPHATATLNYNSIKDARDAVAAYDNTYIAGRSIRVTLKRHLKLRQLKCSSTSVKIRGLPLDTTLSGWDHIFPPLSLQSDKPANGILTSIKRTVFDEEEAFIQLRKDVDKASRVTPADYKREELPGGLSGVQIQFHTWEQARRVRDALQGCRPCYIGRKMLSIRRLEEPYLFTITISIQQFKAQEKLILSVMDSNNRQARLEVVPGPSTDVVSINVVGNNSSAAGALKVRAEQLLAGEVLFLWEDVLGLEEGAEFLEKLSCSTGVYLSIDRASSMVRAYGNPSVIRTIREVLLKLPGDLGSRTFKLDPCTLSTFVANWYPILQEMAGAGNVSLNLRSSPPTVTVKGGIDIRHIVLGLISKPPPLLEGQASKTKAKANICPVCFNEVKNGMKLECEHSYCYNCLRRYLISAVESDKFPVICVGGDGTCEAPVPIQTLTHFLTRNQLAQLFEKSFLVHLDRYPHRYRNCQTPSCPQIYQVSQDKEEPANFDCPSCFRLICTGCHNVEHSGISCETWHRNQNPGEQERMLKKWVEKRRGDVKQCPRCEMLIEKVAGCSHLQCRCGAHICWNCRAVFFSNSQTYEHIINFCRI